MEWYLNEFKKYAVISGRSTRKEFWYFTLANFIILCLAIGCDNLFETTIGNLPYGIFYFLFGLVLVLPGTAVSVRRLHDIGKSGWMLFIALIPIAGPIWLIILFCTESVDNENEYGL